MDAYDARRRRRARAVLLDFSELEYMNSGGIGLLVTLLVRANRREAAAARVRAQRPLPPDLRADPARRGDHDLRRRGRQRWPRSREERTMSEQQQTTARDDDNWAKPIDRLAAGNVPPARSTRVGGKQVVSPIQGFGKMWQKTYRVALAGPSVTPQEVIATWKAEFPTFWPKGSQFHAPLTGIAPGEVALLQASRRRRDEALDRRLRPLRRRGVVHVHDAAGAHVRRLDHVLGGRGGRRDRGAVPGADARAGSAHRDRSRRSAGTRRRTASGRTTLRALARALRRRRRSRRRRVVCVDKRRQWGRAGNVRHSSAFRSTIHTATSPLRKRK